MALSTLISTSFCLKEQVVDRQSQRPEQAEQQKPYPKDHDSFQETAVSVVDSFDDMGLSIPILRGIYTYGYERPSSIQQRAIVPIIKGGDVIAQAQSGTGKTGAFSIGLLQRLDINKPKQCQALVLEPTRELAQQTENVLSALGQYLGDHVCHVFVGGTRVAADIQALSRGVMVCVGTPGRIVDLMKRGSLRGDGVSVLVLDEADEVLSQGFADQIYDIFRYLSQNVQVCLVSATMPDEVLALTTKFMRNPTRILVKKDALTLEGIAQFYVALEEADKLDTLLDLYEHLSIAQAVIFCNSRKKVDWLSSQLNERKFTVSSIHAEMTKPDRERVLLEFKNGVSRILITTDLLGRGIDVQHVNLVINFDLSSADKKEAYLHRIGRSGRFGRTGVAINFVTPRDVSTVKELQTYYQTEIKELPEDFAKLLQ